MNHVLTMGTFDLMHPGHVHLFSVCRLIAGTGGDVTVAVNPDAFIAQFKGRPPIQTYEERAALVGACRYVDRVVPNLAGPDARPTIEQARPNFLLIGEDWAGRDYHAQLSTSPEWLAEHGIALLYVERRPGLSSTDLKARIRKDHPSHGNVGTDDRATVAAG